MQYIHTLGTPLAQPAQPQQLFVLAAYQGAADAALSALAQALAAQFAHGLVVRVLLAAPDAGACSGLDSSAYSQTDTATTTPQHAPHALLTAITHWQQRSGLPVERTAVMGYGQLANEALAAWASQPAFCARLFAIGWAMDGAEIADITPNLPAPEPAQVHDNTCVYCLCGPQPPAAMQQLQHAVRAWQALNTPEGLALDVSLDVLPELTSAVSPTQPPSSVSSPSPTASASSADPWVAVQQRVLWLLQNHVPLKIWRAALAVVEQHS